MIYPLKRIAAIYCLFAFVWIAVASAAPRNESLAGQIQRAKALIGSQQLVKARPLLQSLRKNPDVDKGVHPTLDFHIALSYVFEYFQTDTPAALQEAIQRFTVFTKTYPKHTLAPVARYNLADLQAASKEFKAALQTYITLYRNPVPGIERDEVLRKIILIYILENQWVAGIPYFEDGMRSAESSQDRVTYAAYLLIAKAKQGNVSDSRQYLEFFNSSAPVFYTPRFNASLMEIGDQLKSEGDLASASLFYRFVRPYEALESGLSHYIESLQREVARYVGNVVLRNFYQQKKTELDNAQADLAALKASTNYTPLLNWRIASVYMDMGRDWEAYWRFRVMVDTYPQHEFAEDILFFSLSLARQLGLREEAGKLSERYLGSNSYEKYRGTVADALSTDYLEYDEFEEIYQLTRWYLEGNANDAAASLLLFKHGMARLTRFETRELVEDFQYFKERYDRSKSALVINYFLGIGQLSEENHQAALELFEEVIADPNTRFRADASFRKALCVMGLDRLVEARDLILDFVAKYPDNPLRAQAELVLGNLVHLLGDVESALGHYYQIEPHTDDPGLLASGEMKVAQIFFDRREEEAAIARLQKFIDAYSQEPEVIPVVVALSDFYDQLDQPRRALNSIQQPLDQFFDMTTVDELDSLLVDYLIKDRALRVMREKTDAFLQEISQSPELLRDLVGDRAKQYRFFKENSQIDALVKYRFVRDDVFRTAILDYYKQWDAAAAEQAALQNESIEGKAEPEPKPYPVVEHAVLEELKAEIRELNQTIPQQTADDWLENRLVRASAADNLPLVVRIEAALAATQEPKLQPRPELVRLIENEAIWSEIGPAGQLWILTVISESRPGQAAGILELAKADFMNTSVELDMHVLLAKTYQRLGQIENAIERYKILIKRFAAADESCEAALTIGRLEIERENFEAARKQLEMILYQNQWRGLRHGQALLWIGRAYAAEAKFSEAHGFFERIMLGYPGFNELLGIAYYEDILALKQMGEMSSAQTVYEAFNMTPGLEDTEAAALIRKEFE
ncbi:tetratricopeptide repeat protein [Coraliomargarita sp. SDUM461003]|uniref:Tetratricopeptide repeat protein n=1 Tax=Thalassobacterium maritimum TaxID=3041265 RepID=A0ABU1AW88_9BACT|nr:tetratricopeptide repeat protein [Coraliomargarita sp. SDUM461003]MDQ8207534.1 tetratricopeptide repeat protein [Coraliomargarita sp. SDUM461003]